MLKVTRVRSLGGLDEILGLNPFPTDISKNKFAQIQLNLTKY